MRNQPIESVVGIRHRLVVRQINARQLLSLVIVEPIVERRTAANERQFADAVERIVRLIPFVPTVIGVKFTVGYRRGQSADGIVTETGNDTVRRLRGG